jgi:glycosyltransferase involved in cell wall biosynthesis
VSDRLGAFATVPLRGAVGVARSFAASRARRASRGWRPYSRLFLVSERRWVTDRELHELAVVGERLGIRVGDSRWGPHVEEQSVFYISQFDFFARAPVETANHYGVAYYHGRPGTPGMPEFDRCYDGLCAHHERISRVQVTHSEMRDVVLSSGIEPAKVFMIPIGVNLEYFPLRTKDQQTAIRRELRIPESAAVVGSFQKDGVGWGAGSEPKLIKGPDVFVRTLEHLRRHVRELFVLLAGPARGYVVAELERIGIPYVHIFPNPNRGMANFAEIGRLYRALDVYLVTSRQEGGPKAVLESMASGVPLVTTRVGHAMDVVRHGENGWVVDVEDVEGLAHWTERVLTRGDEAADVAAAARRTAEENSYEAQIPLWRRFMEGFVELGGGGASAVAEG